MGTITDSDELTGRFHAALKEPELILRLDRNLFGGQALIHLEKPGVTVRSKPIALTPVIVGDPGQLHSEMLGHLASALEQAGR